MELLTDRWADDVVYLENDLICYELMNGALGHSSALVRLYWAGDNLG